MKKIIYILLVFVSAVTVFFLGPRPGTHDEITFDTAAIDTDLDAYLANSEADIANLKPGAEKEIIWANPTLKSRTPLALVYIHGFSATKHEVRPVPDNVAKALGANLYFARLKGHGRDGDGLAEATVQAWANDFAEAIAIGERIGEKIIIMATSNGGMVTTWGISKPEYAKNVAGVVYVSPNFELRAISTSLANIPWAETILPLISGTHRNWEPRNELHRKWWTYSYPTRAVFPMTAMLKTVKELDLSQIEIPGLFFFSPKDRVVVPAEIEKAINAWGAPVEAVRIKNPSDKFGHVLMGDALGPDYNEKATRKIVEWINALP